MNANELAIKYAKRLQKDYGEKMKKLRDVWDIAQAMFDQGMVHWNESDSKAPAYEFLGVTEDQYQTLVVGTIDKVSEEIRKNVEVGPSGYRHKEAFCLMTYQCGECGTRERIWNSRDGVTPFMISCSRHDCEGMMEHVEWDKDVCNPDYMPKFGERVFITLTKEKSELYARVRLGQMLKGGYELPEGETMRSMLDGMQEIPEGSPDCIALK